MAMKEEKRRKISVSAEGRLRQGVAGAKNMAKWYSDGGVQMVARENEDAAKRAEALIERMVAELGGKTKLSARQASLIESQRTCLLVLCLARVRLGRKGIRVLVRGNRPDPLLTVIATYSTLVRKNLEALGISDDAQPNAPGDGEPSTMAERLTARWNEQQAALKQESDAHDA